VSRVIVLPTAKMHCACGNRIAPNKTAADRMGLSMMARNVRTCSCGALVIDDLTASRQEAIEDALRGMLEDYSAAQAESGVCSCCNAKPSDVRIEVRKGEWQGWCLECVEERDEVIHERFGDYISASKAPSP
jgi:hypothetical protein